MTIFSIIKQSVKSGLIAAIAMMPPGILFKFLGLQVGSYGPKFANFLFGEINPPIVFIQHLVIACFSAVPLIFLFSKTNCYKKPVLSGTIYGVFYYVAVNSLLLPLFFKDPTPWELGFNFIYPSLVVHIVYGAVVGFTARHFIKV